MTDVGNISFQIPKDEILDDKEYIWQMGDGVQLFEVVKRFSKNIELKLTVPGRGIYIFSHSIAGPIKRDVVVAATWWPKFVSFIVNDEHVKKFEEN